MTQVFSQKAFNRPEHHDLRQSTDIGPNDFRDKSYEMPSGIYPTSNASDSFTISGQSTRITRRSELRNLKGERYMSKLTRSASNSPRIEYNANPLLDSIKNKATLLGASSNKTQGEGGHESHSRNSSQVIEELESQWKAMKQQHNDHRQSQSPYKNTVGLESPGLSKSDASKSYTSNSFGKDRLEGPLASKRLSNYEKSMGPSNLLSKVIPQAKINLVPSQNRNGLKHSKSLETKHGASPRSNYGNKKGDPLKAIYDKYSNINKKKEQFSNENDLSIRKLILIVSLTQANLGSARHTDQSYENLDMRNRSQERGSGFGDNSYTSSTLHYLDTNLNTIENTPPTTHQQNSRVVPHSSPMTKYLDSSLKNESKSFSSKTIERAKLDLISSSREYAKAAFLEASVKNNNNQYPASASHRYIDNKQEESRGPRFFDQNSRLSDRENSDIRPKLLYYEPSCMQEQESLFNAPATLEKPTKHEQKSSPSPMRANISIVKSIKINSSSNKQDVSPDVVSAFNINDEKVPFESKGQLKGYLDSLTEKIKLKLNGVKTASEGKEDLLRADERPMQQLKPSNDLSIQRPLQFITKEANFSPSKKTTPDSSANLKFRKENQFKQEQKFSPEKPVISKAIKHISNEKAIENSPYNLKDKGYNIASSHQVISSRPKTESISLKTEFVSLESARLQKHKIAALGSATKTTIGFDSKIKDSSSFYYAVTQEDTSQKDLSLEQPTKSKLKKGKSIEIVKPSLKRSEENIIKQKSNIENNIAGYKGTAQRIKDKSKSMKVRK